MKGDRAVQFSHQTSSPQLQIELEEAVHRCNPGLVGQLVQDGADPFAFPAHALAASFSRGLRKSALRIAGLTLDSDPRRLSVLGHVLTSSTQFAMSVLPEIFDGKKLDRPLAIVRSHPGEGRQVQNLDLLEFIGKESFVSDYSRSREVGLGILPYVSVFNAHDLDAPVIRKSLAQVALGALQSGEEIMRLGAGNEKHVGVHATIGFQIFADLVLRGIDVPKERLPARCMEFNCLMPLMSSALYFGDCDPPRPVRDGLMKRLIDMGVPVNAASLHNHQTPLMHAAQRADLRAMHILVEAGANVFSKDNRNWTAASFAKISSANAHKKAQSMAYLDAAAALQSINDATQKPAPSRGCTGAPHG